MSMTRAEKIVNEMYAKDGFSSWLGIEVVEVLEGKAVCQMEVRKEMLNGHGVMHGGVSYSLADSAFAFASNSHGQKALSIETSINHIKPVFEVVGKSVVVVVGYAVVGFAVMGAAVVGDEVVGIVVGSDVGAVVGRQVSLNVPDGITVFALT